MVKKPARLLAILFAFVYLAQGSVPASSNAESWKQLDDMAIRLNDHGDYQKAKAVWLKALAKAQTLKPTESELATIYGNLAGVEETLGHPEAALGWRIKVVEILESTTGKESIETAYALASEARCLTAQKLFPQAENVFKSALLILEKNKEDEPTPVLSEMNELARCYHSAHNWSKAEETYKTVLEKAESMQGEDSSLVSIACSGLGSLYFDEKKYRQAEQQWERAYQIDIIQGVAFEFDGEGALNRLLLLYERQKQSGKAAQLREVRLERAKARLASGCWFDKTQYANYLHNLIRQGHKAEANELERFRATHDRDHLQGAIDCLDTNPQWAEQRLKTLAIPSAKVYLAYLYFTGKVAVPNRSKRVDRLMNEAIEALASEGSLGAIESNQHYHYNSLFLLLQHMRFLTEADPLSGNVPESIFADHPQAAFEGFQSWWGSLRDGYPNIAFNQKHHIRHIPAVAKFEKLIDEMSGNPAPGSQGTIASAWGRNQNLSMMKASIGPQAYLSTKGEGAPHIDPKLDRYLEVWSNQELWNKVKYQQWLQSTREAEAALAKHYVAHFGFAQSKARLCAGRAIAEINARYLGEYPPSLIDEAEASPVYRTFRKGNLTLIQAQQMIGNRSFTKDELKDALRLAILNNGSSETIDWLIKKGAPLTGDREPALFTAVRRPEVVALLLKAGADVNEANLLGKTALIQAAQFNSLDSIKELLAAGARIGHPMKSVEETKEALYNNPDYNYKVGSRTPLMYASEFARYGVIRYLLDRGADSKVVDDTGATAERYLASNKLLSQAERRNLMNEFRQK